MDLAENPSAALAKAAALQQQARRAGRWLYVFEIVFGVASFGLALGYGLLPSRTATVILMPIWLVVMLGLAVYAGRRRSTPRGAGRIHGAVMCAWALTWGLTVVIGTGVLQGRLWPWLVGGTLMLGICLVGAGAIRRATT